MAQVSKRFVDETLWPEFQEISETLQAYFADITDRVVAQVIHQDASEAEVVKKPIQIPLPSGEENPSSPASDQSDQDATPLSSSPNKGGQEGRAKQKRKKRKKRKR